LANESMLFSYGPSPMMVLIISNGTGILSI
jgi:hypothetical protein